MDINTTPLVDVLLVLLVMLIITIPIQLHAVDVEMPGRNAPQPAVPPAVVQLDVAPDGRFSWNGEVLADRAALEQRLRDAAAQQDQPEIHLHPHPRAKYDAVAAALSSAQRLGLVKIGLVGGRRPEPRFACRLTTAYEYPALVGRGEPQANRGSPLYVSYSDAPCTHMKDCRSIMSRALKPGLRSRSRRITVAKVSRSW